MGRKLTAVRVEQKPNGVSHDKVYVAPRVAEENMEAKDFEVKECTEENLIIEKYPEKQEVLSVKSSNLDAGLPEDKYEKHGDGGEKFGESKKSSPFGSKSPGNLRGQCTVPQPFTLETEKRGPCMHAVGTDAMTAGVYVSPNHQSPSAKKNSHSQPSSPLSLRKHLQPDRKYHDEEDNWSLASSSKVTVGVAPTFRSVGRAERRKEFYQKLGEKNQALEAEKSQYETRTKEEQEAAIKQLRKTLIIKANPVPNFYYEGPLPKVELKKLPLTRAKSPNFTRRKSCGDAVYTNQQEKGGSCARVKRHSFGSVRAEPTNIMTTKIKGQTSGRNNVNSGSKVRDRVNQNKEITKTTKAKIPEQRSNLDIRVQS